MAREIDETMAEIEATTDDFDETMADVEAAMTGLHQEFELLQRELQWGIILFVVTVTVVSTFLVLLLFLW